MLSQENQMTQQENQMVLRQQEDDYDEYYTDDGYDSDEDYDDYGYPEIERIVLYEDRHKTIVIEEGSKINWTLAFEPTNLATLDRHLEPILPIDWSSLGNNPSVKELMPIPKRIDNFVSMKTRLDTTFGPELVQHNLFIYNQHNY
jgi:hypothetical protein